MNRISRALFAVALSALACVVWAVTPATIVPDFYAARGVAHRALSDLHASFERMAAMQRLRMALWAQAFQGTIAAAQATGVVGEPAYDGPFRVQPGVLKGTAANLVVGRWFTRDPADGLFQPGGDAGVPGGILCNPKAYALTGTVAGGPLAPTMTLLAGTVGEFMTMGYVWVALSNAAAVDAGVWYDDVTGALGAGVASTGQTQIAGAAVVRFANANPGVACISLTGN